LNARIAAGVALIALAVAGFVAGRSLASGNSGDGVAFDLTAPAYASQADVAGVSRAGFTGLEEGTGISGGVLRAGPIASFDGATLSFAGSSGPASIRFDGPRALRRISAASAGDLAAGANVIVLLDGAGSGVATGVMIVAP